MHIKEISQLINLMLDSHLFDVEQFYLMHKF